MSIHRNVFFAAVTGVVGLAGVAGAAPITLAHHEGATDPTTEGWAKDQQDTTGTTAAAVTNDTGGLDAWKVADTSNSGHLYYEKTFTTQQVQDAVSAGWVMRVRLRALGTSDAADYGISYLFNDAVSDKRWGLTVGTDDDGEPEVTLYGSGPGRVYAERLGNNPTGTGHHLYELAYDPGTGTATFSIDGTVQTTEYAGGAVDFTTSTVSWGGVADNPTGEANYNLVEFEVVPEPATLGLSALGGLFLLSARHRGTR